MKFKNLVRHIKAGEGGVREKERTAEVRNEVEAEVKSTKEDLHLQREEKVRDMKGEVKANQIQNKTQNNL